MAICQGQFYGLADGAQALLIEKKHHLVIPLRGADLIKIIGHHPIPAADAALTPDVERMLNFSRNSALLVEVLAMIGTESREGFVEIRNFNRFFEHS